MSLPETVQSALGDESVAARVGLGGEDELFVTPTRSLVYRAEGLLSDESVEEYPHGAERIEVSEGRRKSKVSLDYGLDGERTMALPTKRVDEALHPILAGTLNAAEVTDAGETVKETFRFSELTLIVTSARVVKHVGTAVWDDDFEEFHYEDVTDLAFESGSVGTWIVVTADGRQERFKTPNDRSRAVREAIESALLAYHGVEDLEAFRQSVAAEDGTADADGEADAEPDAGGQGIDFGGEGLDPLSADPSEPDDVSSNATVGGADDGTKATDGTDGATAVGTVEAGAAGTTGEGRIEVDGADGPVDSGGTDGADGADGADGTGGTSASGLEEAGFESAEAMADRQVAAELAALQEAVEAQSEQLQRQQQLIEQLIRELRQGR